MWLASLVLEVLRVRHTLFGGGSAVSVTAPTNRPAVDLGSLGAFTIDSVLYEAEEPIVFTISVDASRKLIGYLADHNTEGRWIIVAPCGPKTLTDLMSGSLPVREALTASWMWLVQVGANHRPIAAWTIDESTIPDGHLPHADLPLLAEHEAILATKAVGAQIKLFLLVIDTERPRTEIKRGCWKRWGEAIGRLFAPLDIPFDPYANKREQIRRTNALNHWR